MTLDFNDNHEITLSILHEDQPYLLWSSGVRFVFVMRGTVSALLHGQTHMLSPAGFCLSIRSNCVKFPALQIVRH